MIQHAMPLAATGLKIDWTRMPTYNTIMSVAAGAGLLLVVALGAARSSSRSHCGVPGDG
ncbi:hypothetical protein [Streptomyces sp. NPDC057545]|uniref:hypothetical protein n=1 Tax=Streptomyces sp. NPDC057545 TaxID=3346164 RepID=UPI0036740AC9